MKVELADSTEEEVEEELCVVWIERTVELKGIPATSFPSDHLANVCKVQQSNKALGPS